MKALIVDGNVIAQVVKNSEVFPVVPSWRWVDCPNKCTPSWTFDGANFAPGASSGEINSSTEQEIVVSPWQFRQALNEIGLRASVEALVKMTDNQDIKDGWEYATEWRSTHPLVKQIAAELKVSDSELRSSFLIASSK